MADNNHQELNSQALPFFARYLEGQFCEDLSEDEMDAVQGGLTRVTLRYPPEGPDGIVTTLKYPSDNEEGGGGDNPIITNKLKDNYFVTKKYPSDGDDHIAVTQKYPSDGDDFSAVLE